MFTRIVRNGKIIELPEADYKATMTAILIVLTSPVSGGDSRKAGELVTAELEKLSFALGEVEFQVGDDKKTVTNVNGQFLHDIANVYASYEGVISWVPGRGGNKGQKAEAERPSLAALFEESEASSETEKVSKK